MLNKLLVITQLRNDVAGTPTQVLHNSLRPKVLCLSEHLLSLFPAVLSFILGAPRADLP